MTRYYALNTTTGDLRYIRLNQRAAASGVASLDSETRLPAAQRPRRSVRSVTTTATITTADDILVAGGTTAYTVTLPSAVTAASGAEITVKRTSTGLVTVGSTAGLVDGAASTTVNTRYSSKTFVSDGTDWMVV